MAFTVVFLKIHVLWDVALQHHNWASIFRHLTDDGYRVKGGVDSVTSASKSVRYLNCTICTFMTWMQVVDLGVGVNNLS